VSSTNLKAPHYAAFSRHISLPPNNTQTTYLTENTLRPHFTQHSVTVVWEIAGNLE